MALTTHGARFKSEPDTIDAHAVHQESDEHISFSTEAGGIHPACPVQEQQPHAPHSAIEVASSVHQLEPCLLLEDVEDSDVGLQPKSTLVPAVPHLISIQEDVEVLQDREPPSLCSLPEREDDQRPPSHGELHDDHCSGTTHGLCGTQEPPRVNATHPRPDDVHSLASSSVLHSPPYIEGCEHLVIATNTHTCDHDIAEPHEDVPRSPFLSSHFHEQDEYLTVQDHDECHSESVSDATLEMADEGVEDTSVPYIMQSALFVDHEGTPHVLPQHDEDGDWTAIDHEEPSTPRVASPTVGVAIVEGPEADVRTDDLAVSAVLLSQSECASAQKPPTATFGPQSCAPVSSVRAESTDPSSYEQSSENAVDNTGLIPGLAANSARRHRPTDLDLSNHYPSNASIASPASPTSSTSATIRVRVHTPDRPDWAVAPTDDATDTKETERERRHSSAHPDWAVAPLEGSGLGSSSPTGGKRKGRKSDATGTGRKRTARKGRHSR